MNNESKNFIIRRLATYFTHYLECLRKQSDKKVSIRSGAEPQ